MDIVLNNMETRQGKDILLLINKDSNYGISQYTPITENNILYSYYKKQKEKFDTIPNWVYMNIEADKIYTREETAKILHCLGCNAAKINNYKRYCKLCPDFFDF